MGTSGPSPVGAWTRIKAFLVWLAARILLATLRVRVLHRERWLQASSGGGPVVFAFWHGRQLGLFKANPADRLVVLASLSRDGEMQARICRRFGLEVIRGSSSRGALAGLLALGRQLKAGASVGLAVDGPRGPVHHAKPGVVALARAHGVPIVPLTIAYKRRLELRRAWDRFQIPAPFTRAVVAYGEPLFIPRAASSERLVEEADRLTRSLRSITEEVDALRGTG